ncbi:TetR/AcrR family transcriptional regulator C-terminal domain-containing protein [Streptomyces rubiginosohelvolus]
MPTPPAVRTGGVGPHDGSAAGRWSAGSAGGFVRPAPRSQAKALTPTQTIHVHLALLGYAQGVAAAVELEAQARQDTGMTPEEWMASNELRLEEIQTAGSYPNLSTLFGEEEFDLELDTLFAFGLARLLDGVASLIERAGSR